MGTVSNLPLEPREMTVETRVLYKWILPSVKGIRATVEEMIGKGNK